MEEWKPIEGYENYEISTEGRVRKGSKILSIPITRGYYRIGLWKNQVCKCFQVHRLVAIHFIPKTDNRDIVNHKNGIKTDNRVSNLEWCTTSENNKHAYDIGISQGRCRKPLMCIETGQIFESTYHAAEWINKINNSTKIVRNAADKIRCACKGIQKIAYGYHWKYIDE